MKVLVCQIPAGRKVDELEGIKCGGEKNTPCDANPQGKTLSGGYSRSQTVLQE